ncbi:uncharacterized protein ACNLHF_009014 [Anomaloglossus baeobatrachus]
MSGLKKEEGDGAESGAARCCGCFSCFTAEEEPGAPKEQTGPTPHHEPRTTEPRTTEPRTTEPRTTFLGELVASLSGSMRKSPIEPLQRICWLKERQPESCPVWLIQLCPACDTLHCHPNYIDHCLLTHHPHPLLEKQRSCQNSGHALVVHGSESYDILME